jgi:hypothetical protein
MIGATINLDHFFTMHLQLEKITSSRWAKNDPIMMSAKAFRLAQKFNIAHWKKYPFLHAEADLMLKLDEKYYNKKTTLLSMKINRHGQFRLAKPCYKCEIALFKSNLTNVVWSLNDDDNLPIPLLDSYLLTANQGLPLITANDRQT